MSNNVLRVREPLHYTVYTEAAKDEGWVQAMQSELDAFENNDTWELTYFLEGKVAINSKWVYKLKFKLNGEIDKSKAY